MRKRTSESITQPSTAPIASLRSRILGFVLPSAAIAIGVLGFRSGWIAFLAYHGAVVLMLSATGAWAGALRGFRLRAEAPGAAWALGALGAVAGVAGACLMWQLWPWYAGRSEALAPTLEALGLHGASWLAFTIYHAVVNPFVEEAYWRGALGEPRAAVGASDVFFAAYHAIVLTRFTGAGPIVLSVVVLTAVAAFWRWTYRRTGSLWPAVLSHVVADAGIMIVAMGRASGSE